MQDEEREKNMCTIKRFTLLALSLALALGLMACGSSGPDMPMEAVIDGHTITLGKTTMEDLRGWGYEVNSAGRQDAARDGDKYIYFMYSLNKGTGHQFWVSVYTPYYGGTNINKESSEASQSGIVYSVSLSQSATEKIAATYNGMDVKDMSFDTAKEWGAKEKEDASKVAWDMTIAQGSLRFEAENTSSEEMHTLRVTMSKSVFEKMQKG